MITVGAGSIHRLPFLPPRLDQQPEEAGRPRRPQLSSRLGLQQDNLPRLWCPHRGGWDCSQEYYYWNYIYGKNRVFDKMPHRNSLVPFKYYNLLYLLLIQNCFETAFFAYMVLISSLWMLLLPFFTWVSLSTAAWLIVCRLLLNYVCVGTSSKNICLHINNFSGEVSRDRGINCFHIFSVTGFYVEIFKNIFNIFDIRIAKPNDPIFLHLF